MILCTLVLVLLSSRFHSIDGNLFKNPDFEDVNNVLDWGHAWGYSQTIMTETSAKSAARYLKVSNRTHNWQGPGQYVAMNANTDYNISCWFRILNNDTRIFQKIKWSLAFQWDKSSNKKDYYDVAERSMQRVSSDWMLLSGDFTTPSRPWYQVNVYIQGPDPGIEFLVDDASLDTITPNANWKTEAKQRIEQLRKNNFTLSVDIPAEYDPLHVELEINLKNHEFGFGSVVQDEHILDAQYSKGYQNIFYEFFNWATVGSFKWKYNRGTFNHPNYDTAVNTVKELRKQGMKVRGHNMFWGVRNNMPAEAQHMNASTLEATIDERIKYMTSITKGMLDHWDVNNELLHGQEFEEITGDPEYSMKIYNKVHAADPHPKLFLNEYDVVAVGALTRGYLEQALDFKRKSHLDAIGVQSHFRSYTAPDPTVIKSRLDLLASAGLPIWVTELTLSNADEHARADWLEDALRTYFSHPSVHGVILWGFWDENGNVDGALVNGNYFSINQAGARYLQLLKKEWSTNIKKQMTKSQEKITLRGFKGDYDIVVRYYGKPILLQHFQNSQSTGTVNVSVPSGNHVITLPTARPTSVPIVHVHHVSTTGKHSVGHATSRASTQNLQCVTRYSSYSQIGDDKSVSVGCLNDEVMTSCSMLTKDLLHFRDGEKFTVESGKVVCTAVNAWRSSAPVQAIARCCKMANLQCNYYMAGPSGNKPDDQIKVACSNNQFATGCTSYTYFGALDGSFSANDSCVAQNDGTDGGVFVYAACCSAPKLSCNVKKSVQSDLKQGSNSSLTCASGEAMAGCSVYTEDGNTAGAVIRDENNISTCYAYNGLDKFPGEMGVVGFATCCS